MKNFWKSLTFSLFFATLIAHTDANAITLEVSAGQSPRLKSQVSATCPYLAFAMTQPFDYSMDSSDSDYASSFGYYHIRTNSTRQELHSSVKEPISYTPVALSVGQREEIRVTFQTSDANSRTPDLIIVNGLKATEAMVSQLLSLPAKQLEVLIEFIRIDFETGTFQFSSMLPEGARSSAILNVFSKHPDDGTSGLLILVPELSTSAEGCETNISQVFIDRPLEGDSVNTATGAVLCGSDNQYSPYFGNVSRVLANVDRGDFAGTLNSFRDIRTYIASPSHSLSELENLDWNLSIRTALDATTPIGPHNFVANINSGYYVGVNVELNHTGLTTSGGLPIVEVRTAPGLRFPTNLPPAIQSRPTSIELYSVDTSTNSEVYHFLSTEQPLNDVVQDGHTSSLGVTKSAGEIIATSRSFFAKASYSSEMPNVQGTSIPIANGGSTTSPGGQLNPPASAPQLRSLSSGDGSSWEPWLVLDGTLPISGTNTPKQ